MQVYLGLIDSQSVKTSCITSNKGYDAGKKVSGRKRHIITDTMGFILAIVVHNADIQDRVGAKLVLKELQYKYPLLKKIYFPKQRKWVKRHPFSSFNRYVA